MEPLVANYTRIFRNYNPYRKTVCFGTKIFCNLGHKTITAILLNFAILMNEAEYLFLLNK